MILDQCADTPESETVNVWLTSGSQMDTDGMEWTDDLDQCADTGTGRNGLINEGCSG